MKKAIDIMTREEFDKCGPVTKELIRSLNEPTELWLVYPVEPMKQFGSMCYYMINTAMDDAAIMSAATGVTWRFKRVKVDPSFIH